MKRTTLLRAEIIVLACLGVVWLIDIRTHWVPHVSATLRGSARQGANAFLDGGADPRDLTLPSRRLVGRWISEDATSELRYEMNIRTDITGKVFWNDPQWGTVHVSLGNSAPTGHNFEIQREDPSTDSVVLRECRFADLGDTLVPAPLETTISIAQDAQFLTRKYTLNGQEHVEVYRYVGPIKRPWRTCNWIEVPPKGLIGDATAPLAPEKEETIADAGTTPGDWTLQEPESELSRLDSYVASERQRIESWYSNCLAGLKRWAETRQKELDGEEKAAWAWCLQQMQNRRSDTNREFTVNAHGYESAYFAPGGYAFDDSHTIVKGRSSEATKSCVVGNPAGEYQEVLSQIKSSREAIEREFARLERERQRAISALERYASNVRGRIASDRRRAERTTRERVEGGPGILDAIFVSGDGEYSAMVDGKIVHKGSWIGGYRVRTITRTYVEFEKDGKVLLQTTN